MLIIFVLYALMALTFSIGQQALQLVPPVWLIGFRMTLAGLLLLGYLYFFKPAQLKLQPRDLGQFLKVTFLHAYLPFVTEFWALQYLSAPKAALLFNLTPVVTALLAYFTQRERLVWPQILGLAIGVLGFMPVLWELAPQELLAGQFFKISLPELALLISVISSAYAWLTVQKLVQQNYAPLFVNGVAMLGGGLLAFFTSAVLEPSWSVLTWSEFNPGPSLSWAEFKWVLIWCGLLILISNLIFYNLYAQLLKKYSATLLAFAGLFTPLFAAGWSWLFHGQAMSGNFYLALLIIATGLSLYLFTSPAKPINLAADEHLL